jgi:thiamine biosynthesis lipoprotein
VLVRCDELREETSGFFDIDAVDGDPSGYVKGWSVDEAAAIVDRAGFEEYGINAGGDIRTRGRWTIGIQHPLEPKEIAQVVEGDDLAVATSGTADAYATAAFAMGGRRAPGWTARLRGYEAMTILSDGRVLSTPNFPSA